MSRPRGIVAGCLLVVGVLLVPFANAAFWGRRHLLDTPRFTALIDEIARAPGVRPMLADRVTDQLVANNALLGVARPLVRAATERVIESSAFLAVLDPAVTSLHEQLLADHDRLTLDFRALVPLIRDEVGRVDRRIAALVPDLGLVSVTVADREDAPALWDGVEAARRGWWIVPVVVLVLLGGAIAIANRRLTMCVLVGIGVAVVSFAMVVVLGASRTSLDGATSGADRDLVRAVWDAVVPSMRRQSVVLMLAGIALAVAAGVARLVAARASRSELAREPRGAATAQS